MADKGKDVTDSEVKMWCAVRTDIDIPTGKLCAQVGHGFVGTIIEAMAVMPNRAKEYMKGATPKITVRADSGEMLMRIHREAVAAGIPSHLVTDAGRTVFNEPTMTVCAFGPSTRAELPAFLKRLQLLQ